MANGTFYAVVEFEDGLQVIPTNWLDINVMKAVWPNFTNSKRCDKAVKFMEEPESTWIKHPVRKVYGRYFNYAVAKKKLKNVEVLSKLNSDTEREEFLKKTRKIRAAKIMDTSTSSSEELSNDSFILDVPTISNVSTKRHYSMIADITQKSKIAKNAQKGLQKHKNIVLFDDALNSTTVYDCDYNSQDPQCSKNLVNIEDIYHWNDNRIMTMLRDNDHNSDPLSVLNPEYTQNLPNIKQEITRNSDNEDNVSVPLAHDMAVLDFEQKSENFQRFIIQKLNNLEMKINRIENNMNAHHKVILQKLAISNVEMEEKEDIDVFEDLPLKDEANLMLMETKLKNDLWYRNQMIKQLTRITCENIKTSCIRLMRAILSNELAMKYSWYGAKKKQVFSQLEICKVIINVIRKLHTDVTDEQIAAPIKVWLVHAKERFGKQSENVNQK